MLLSCMFVTSAIFFFFFQQYFFFSKAEAQTLELETRGRRSVTSMSAAELPRPGSRVRLKGLTKPEYNGLEGTVKDSQRAAAEGRLCVVLDGNAVPSVAKSACLPWLGEKSPAVELMGLMVSIFFAPVVPGR